MADEELNGKVKKAKGQIREEIGKLTGNKEEQIKGKLEQAEGSIREELGKSEKKLKKFAEKTEPK